VKESERISATIKALRSKLGETQAGMARLLGASLRTYDRWEAGHSIPRGNKLVNILALCRDNELKSLFDATAGSSVSKASGKDLASSVLTRAGPGDRLRMRFRDSCLAAIQIIYESALLGSEAADEKLRNYAAELNREAAILADGLFETQHPMDVNPLRSGSDAVAQALPRSPVSGCPLPKCSP
jgi:transcriptional regulator with XRE-family HTH domain